MEDAKRVEQDRQRAEVFDSLGHPTRILILKVLSEGALGFSELKKKTAIESSGHLQHHLTKLNGLIKTDEYGKYCLSDEGKDALLTVHTVENTSIKSSVTAKAPRRYFGKKLGWKSVALILILLLAASSAIALISINHFIFTQNLELQNIATKGPDYFQNGPIYQTINDITSSGKTVGQVSIIVGPPYANSSEIPLLFEITQSPNFSIDSVEVAFSSSIHNPLTYQPDFYIKPSVESDSKLAQVYSSSYPYANEVIIVEKNNPAVQGTFYQELIFSPINPNLSKPLEFYFNLSVTMHENSLIQLTSLKLEKNITLSADALIPLFYFFSISHFP
jgi:DNA-binding HxlR family transcriptional regulator